MTQPHEMAGPSGIVLPDPDQGTPYIAVQFAMPSTLLMLWEPFPDASKHGHNLLSFVSRWAAWERSDDPFLQSIDLRFGHPLFIPRAAIEFAIGISIQYHRAEDARAGHRGLVQPRMRTRPDGSIEVLVPR